MSDIFEEEESIFIIEVSGAAVAGAIEVESADFVELSVLVLSLQAVIAEATSITANNFFMANFALMGY